MRFQKKLHTFSLPLDPIINFHNCVQAKSHPMADEEVDELIFFAHAFDVAVIGIVGEFREEVSVERILHVTFPIGKIHADAGSNHLMIKSCIFKLLFIFIK